MSPRDEDNALWINQDARFALTKLDAGKTLEYKNAFNGNGIYLVVINGSIEIDGKQLNKRDSAGISGTDTIKIKATADSELLAIEVPMN